MDERASFKNDIGVLMDMYPELHLDVPIQDIDDSSSSVIHGCLPFAINLMHDVEVEYMYQRLIFSKMPGNRINFKVRPCDYPSNIHFTIESDWMLKDTISSVVEAVRLEFDAFIDPRSTFYDPFTPVLMLIFGYLIEDSGSHIFESTVLECESEEEYEKFVTLHKATECERIGKSNFNCVICMETKKGSKMIRLPCNHFLCAKCTKSYFTAMIEEGSINKVRCPECGFSEPNFSDYHDYQVLKRDLFKPAIPFEFFEKILTDDLCVRYRNLFHAQAATKLAKHCAYACVTCPRCEKWCVKDDLNSSMIQCQACKFAFCFNCLHSWHGYNNKCGKKLKIADTIIKEYIDSSTAEERKKVLETKYGKKILEVEIKEYLADKMLDMAIAEEGSDLQRCPQCLLVIQRSEGCNKMKCTICETLFCNLCGDLLYPEDPYEHYREPYSPCYGRLFEGMQGIDS